MVGTLEGVDWKMRLVRMVGRMQWLRLGLRRRFVKMFYPPESAPEREFLVDFRGLKYRGTLASFIDWHVFFFGGYELAELDVIEDVTAAIDSCVSLDVGANVGHHTLIIAKHSAQVHAFEPLPALRRHALDQVALNGMERIEIHPFGLGAETASIPYHFNSASRNRGTGSFVASHDPRADSHENLDIVRGDDWFARAGVKGVDFVKIDVEGFEADVLAGLSGVLTKYQPVILVEITGTAAEGFDRRGGFSAVIPFAAQYFRVAKAPHRLGVLSTGRYRLSPVPDPKPEKHSYNVLVIPERRRDILARLTGRWSSSPRAR